MVVGGGQVQGLLVAAESRVEVFQQHRLGFVCGLGTVEALQGDPAELSVALNWFTELKRTARAGK